MSQKKLKVFELFAGYGGASWAFKKANIDFETVGFSEVDKYAIQCYHQNHAQYYSEAHVAGTSHDKAYQVKNYGDISAIQTKDLPDFDVLTGGFPCTDVSIAGKRDLSKGRTTLFDHIIRIAKDKKPKWMILENVEGILSMPYPGFYSYHDYVLKSIRAIGYSVAHKLMNSKEHGTPQNRPRYVYVCKLGEFEFGEVVFPNQESLKITLNEIREKDVAEKYYLTERQFNKVVSGSLKRGRDWEKRCDGDTAMCLTARHQKRSFNDINFITNHDELCVPVLTPRRGTKRQNGRQFKENGEPSFTITTQDRHGIYDGLKIRVLTPKECFRLMGFFHDEISVNEISDNQQYHLAGNGWDVNMFAKLFKTIDWWR